MGIMNEKEQHVATILHVNATQKKNVQHCYGSIIHIGPIVRHRLCLKGFVEFLLRDNVMRHQAPSKIAILLILLCLLYYGNAPYL